MPGWQVRWRLGTGGLLSRRTSRSWLAWSAILAFATTVPFAGEADVTTDATSAVNAYALGDAVTDAPPVDAPPSGPLEVVRFQPEGEVDVAPFLAVTFSEPMVALVVSGLNACHY